MLCMGGGPLPPRPRRRSTKCAAVEFSASNELQPPKMPLQEYQFNNIIEKCGEKLRHALIPQRGTLGGCSSLLAMNSTALEKGESC